MSLKIICVKAANPDSTGPKRKNNYTHVDVNRLYAACQAKITENFDFYCLTDDDTDLHADINVINIDASLGLQRSDGNVWWKMCVFDKRLWNSSDLVMYFDLDIRIRLNIDSMLSGTTSGKLKTCMIGDHWQSAINSSLWQFNGHEMDDVYTEFIANKTSVMATYAGNSGKIDPYMTVRWPNIFEPFDYPGDYYTRGHLQLRDEDALLLDSDNNYIIQFEPVDSMRVYFVPTSKICLLTGFHAKRTATMADYDEKLAAL